MKQILVIILFFLVVTGFSQQIPQAYFVAFTDKNGSPYSTGDPQAFLTQRAIDRRTAQGIPVTTEDLPVNPPYVTAVAATGVQVLTRCKWFNGITVKVTDTAVLPSIKALPFVQSVTRVSSYNSKKSSVGDRKFSLEEPVKSGAAHEQKTPGSATTFDYGPSFNQIHLMNGEVLHELGYRGQGKVIAVLDAGFQGADTAAVFDSLRAYNLILGTRDFVNPGGNVYSEFWHGAAVLSTMGGNTPGQLIGTAPKAAYWLIRTEEADHENIVEEYNWVVGAEMADSVGADVINSSLGYTTFDNGWMDHTCSDMNGYTNPSARGANIAANKGMAISISAGNLGGSSWTCVSSPSDALEAMSIGAVDESGQYASFSSTGIVAWDYVKPNIAAQGMNAYIYYPGGYFGTGNGTSFASPINAGMMACLCQARPTLNQTILRKIIEESASQYNTPDIYLGYGIPDYSKALTLSSIAVQSKNHFQAYPNPFTNAFTVSWNNYFTGNLEISLIAITGSTVMKTNKMILAGGENNVTVNGLGTLPPAVYLLKITAGPATEYLHLVKITK